MTNIDNQLADQTTNQPDDQLSILADVKDKKPAPKRAKKIKDAEIQPAQDFKQAFALLKKNAELLEQQQEPDLDQLMHLVEQSMQAYNVCKDRINAVQAALNQTFES